MTTALEEAVSDLEEESARLSALRDRIIRELCAVPGVVLTGDPDNRLPGFASFAVDGVGHSVHLVNALNEKGICVSSGSACSAASREASHVLLALGFDSRLSAGSLRITLGRDNTEEQADRLLSVLPDIIARQRLEAKKEPAVVFSRPSHAPDPDD